MQVEERSNKLDYSHEVEHRTLGDVRSIYRGYGMDYDESRPYFPGDELRFMNWRVTARTGEPHMKVFREERKPGVFIVVDRRQSMRFGTRRRLKVTQAIRAASIIAFASHRQNSPVAGVLLQSADSTSLSWIDESFDEAGIFSFIHAANSPCPVNSNPLPSANESDSSLPFNEVSLAHIIRLLTPMLAQGRRVVLISDFLDMDDECRASLLALAMTHHLQAIHIVDPVEKTLPACGHLLVQDESNQAISLNSSEKNSRLQYDSHATSFVESKQQLFRSLAIPCNLLLTTDDDIENIISVC
jgi:hypothetical protein